MDEIEFNPIGLIDRAALEFLKSKKLLPSFSHYDVWMHEHAVAFTVAKMMDADLLHEVKSALEDAIASGSDFNVFKQRLKPYLMSRGWYGEQVMMDPIDGIEKVVQLGSTRRLETIFQTNMATAYAAGQWQRIQSTKSALPYLRYNASAAGNPREAHKRYYGLVLPVEHKLWNTIYPPNGYGCLCTVTQLTRKQAEKYGISEEPDVPMVEFTNPRTGEVVTIPASITPSFAHNHANRLDNLDYLFREKHGNAALSQLQSNRSEHMSERLERPNFLNEKPSLKLLRDGKIENAQALIYSHAGRGFQLGSIPVGQVGSTEWIKVGEQYIVLRYQTEGIQLIQVDKDLLVELKEAEIGHLQNVTFNGSDFDVLVGKKEQIQQADFGDADYADKLAAFMYTTDGGYKAVNPALIQHKGKLENLNPTTLQIVRSIDQFLIRARKYKGATTRLLDSSKMPNPTEFLNAHSAGALVRYSNFTSTSKGSSVFGGHLDVDIVLTINSVTGIDITQISRFGAENEVLFSRSAVYKIKKTEMIEGVHHIILDEVTDFSEKHDNIVQLSLNLAH